MKRAVDRDRQIGDARGFGVRRAGDLQCLDQVGAIARDPRAAVGLLEDILQFVGKAQYAATDVHDVDFVIDEIDARPDREEKSRTAVLGHLRHEAHEIVHVLDGVDAIQIRLDRRQPAAFRASTFM